MDTTVKLRRRKRVNTAIACQMDCGRGSLISSCCLPWCRCAQRDDDETEGKKLCDNCPKAAFVANRAVVFCMPRPVLTVMPFLPQQAKQTSLAVLGRTGQFG